jgi:hypothetical protein
VLVYVSGGVDRSEAKGRHAPLREMGSPAPRLVGNRENSPLNCFSSCSDYLLLLLDTKFLYLVNVAPSSLLEDTSISNGESCAPTMQSTAPASPYQCIVCSTSFNRVDHLNRHLLVRKLGPVPRAHRCNDLRFHC